MGQIRVPRKGVTPAELANVLSRRLGGGFEVAADHGTVVVRRSPLSAAVVRIGNAPGATPQDIAWLKLEVASHRGSGLFSDVTTVQRINTKGGMLAGACEQAGSFQSAPYSADYVFLRKG